MGILSDPSLSTRGKLARTVVNHSNKISIVLYIAGIVWFICLGYQNFNHETYLSENALSPGLVYPEIKQDASRQAQQLFEEFRREREEYKTTMPIPWIVAKMKQIGLETHIHNFTLEFPFSEQKKYSGNNVYGIIRAARIASTEGIVFSVPYRAVNSIHEDISAGIPLLLAFADFARRKNYWSKNIIFLITEQEQLGLQAWLDAYFDESNSKSSVIKCGTLPARAGALLAALNLEIQDFNIDYVNVKIEGLNGQLPNLDMFNLVQRIASREGILSGYKPINYKKRRSPISDIKENLKNIIAMLLSQLSGVPTGNHGLFHRYRIESLTLEAVKRDADSNNRNTAALPLLKVVEGISRSLNNLLERFHQSFFFYILVQNDRFVSIGDYTPCLILFAGPMFIKAFLLWLSALNGDNVDESSTTENVKESIPHKIPFKSLLLVIGSSVSIGLVCITFLISKNARIWLTSLGNDTPTAVSSLIVGIVAISLLLPLLISLPTDAVKLLSVLLCISLGIAIIVLGLLHFALSFFIAIIVCPLALIMPISDNSNSNRLKVGLSKIYLFCINPLFVVHTIVFVITIRQFPELEFTDMFKRSITATRDAITFAIMDDIIYGNTLYTVITVLFLPLWSICWTLNFSKRNSVHEN